MAINRAFISGNLTRDAEVRVTPSGYAICEFSVAVNDRRRNKQTGEWEDDPQFVDCKLLGSRAESLAQYLSKGTKVSAEGRLKVDTWQDRETGKNRSKTYVLIDEVEFLSRSNGAGGHGGGGMRQEGYRGQNAPQDAAQAVQGAFPGTHVTPYATQDIPF